MPKPRYKVLLLENYRQTLSVARSLAQAGHEVHVAVDARAPSLYDRALAASQAVSAVCPLPAVEAPEFLPQLQAYCQTQSLDALFPVGELSLPWLQPGLAQLPPVVGVRPELRALFLDKDRGGQAAAAAGLAVPASRGAGGPGSLMPAIAAVGLPCVVKAQDSLRPLARKAWLLEEPPSAELQRELEESNVPLLVQACIRGRRINCMFLARAGELSAYFEDEVLRTDRADGTGVGLLERSVAPTPALVAQLRDLIRQLDYDGPGCLQFIDDGQQAWFLECNPRLDASVALAVHCGVDLPRLALEARLEEPGQPAEPRLGDYLTGQKLHGLLSDLEGSMQGLLYGLPPGRVLAWQLRALRDACRADCSLLADRRDPRPARLLGRYLLGTVGLRLTGRRRGPGLSSDPA